MKLIEIKNITKEYSVGEIKIKALDNVSLQISKGEFVAITGQSGSGKSTLMNILGCLDKPESGTYILNGQDVFRANEKKLSEIRNKEIGFIFQSFNLINSLSAAENIELPLIYRGIKKKRTPHSCSECTFYGRTGKQGKSSSHTAFGRTAAACRHSKSNSTFSPAYTCR